jgi:beta-phosphoglucomutase-like phosphatase (HAD superfamily)
MTEASDSGPLQAVLFDMDGLLVDTEPIWYEIESEAMATLGGSPDLADRARLVRLLRPERIGVELTEGFQLVPEQATDALVVHHPEAKYFSV